MNSISKFLPFVGMFIHVKFLILELVIYAVLVGNVDLFGRYDVKTQTIIITLLVSPLQAQANLLLYLGRSNR